MRSSALCTMSRIIADSDDEGISDGSPVKPTNVASHAATANDGNDIANSTAVAASVNVNGTSSSGA